jgi:hypothetical protein
VFIVKLAHLWAPSAFNGDGVLLMTTEDPYQSNYGAGRGHFFVPIAHRLPDCMMGGLKPGRANHVEDHQNRLDGRAFLGPREWNIELLKYAAKFNRYVEFLRPPDSFYRLVNVLFKFIQMPLKV